MYFVYNFAATPLEPQQNCDVI